MKKILLIFPMFIIAETCNYEGISIVGVSGEEFKGDAIQKSDPVVDGTNIGLDL